MRTLGKGVFKTGLGGVRQEPGIPLRRKRYAHYQKGQRDWEVPRGLSYVNVRRGARKLIILPVYHSIEIETQKKPRHGPTGGERTKVEYCPCLRVLKRIGRPSQSRHAVTVPDCSCVF